MPCCRRNELFAPAKEERVGCDKQRVGPALDRRGKRGINLSFVACVDDAELDAKRARRSASSRNPNVGSSWKARVHQDRNQDGVGNEFAHQLYAFWLQRGREKTHAGRVAMCDSWLKTSAGVARPWSVGRYKKDAPAGLIGRAISLAVEASEDGAPATCSRVALLHLVESFAMARTKMNVKPPEPIPKVTGADT